MRQQLLHPAGRGGRRAADDEPRVDLAHGGRGDVVQLQVVLGRAGPEDLQVGLVPDLEGPPLDDLVAVALHEVGGEVAHQVVPALPVLGRRDDRVVAEDRLGRVAGQVVRHERDLDDGVEPERPDVVVDPVDAGEVVHRAAVDLAVDRQVVAEDPVRPHLRHAELAVRRGQRGAELLADHAAAGGVGRQGVREVLAADHRLPRTVQLADDRRGVDGHGDGSGGLRERGGRHDGRQGTVDVDVGERRHGVPPLDAGRPGRVDVRRVRHRGDVATVVVERLPRPVGGVGDVHLVADRPLHRRPGQRHLRAAGHRPEAARRAQPRCGTAEGVPAAQADPALPVGACVGRHEVSLLAKVSSLISGRSVFFIAPRLT